MLRSVRNLIESVALGAADSIDAYNQKRIAYNNSVPLPAHRLHIVPFLRANRSHSELYLSITWARLVNENYLYGQGNAKTGKTQLRELRRRSPPHFSQQDLRATLNANNAAALPLLLEAEHAFRYWRNEYLKLSGIRREVKAIVQTELQRALIANLTAHQNGLACPEWAQQAISLVNAGCIDPVNLRKADAIYQFETSPDAIDESLHSDIDDETPL